MYKILVLLIALLTMFTKKCNHQKDGGTSCEMTGTIKDFTGLDGCQLLIVLDNGEKLEPTQLPDGQFDMKDGQKVRLSYKEMPDAMSICMAGKIVAITCIELVKNKPEKMPCIETLDPYEVEWMQMALNKVRAFQVIRYQYLADGFAYYFMGQSTNMLLDCQGTLLCEAPAKESALCDEKASQMQDELIIWEIE